MQAASRSSCQTPLMGVGGRALGKACSEVRACSLGLGVSPRVCYELTALWLLGQFFQSIVRKRFKVSLCCWTLRHPKSLFLCPG